MIPFISSSSVVGCGCPRRKGNASTQSANGAHMKRFRLGTLMLLVVLAGLATALAVQQYRASRREAAMQAEIAYLRATSTQLQKGSVWLKGKPWSLKLKLTSPARSTLLCWAMRSSRGRPTGESDPHSPVSRSYFSRPRFIPRGQRKAQPPREAPSPARPGRARSRPQPDRGSADIQVKSKPCGLGFRDHGGSSLLAIARQRGRCVDRRGFWFFSSGREASGDSLGWPIWGMGCRTHRVQPYAVRTEKPKTNAARKIAENGSPSSAAVDFHGFGCRQGRWHVSSLTGPTGG